MEKLPCNEKKLGPDRASQRSRPPAAVCRCVECVERVMRSAVSSRFLVSQGRISRCVHFPVPAVETGGFELTALVY